jgi:hypothetical protein
MLDGREIKADCLQLLWMSEEQNEVNVGVTHLHYEQQ